MCCVSVLVQMGCCTGTCTGTVCGVARRGYRSSDKQLTVFVSLALHGRLRAAAGVEGCSLQEFVERVLRGAVEEPVSVGGGQVGSVGPDWGAVLAAGRAAKSVRVVEDVVEPDPLEGIA